MSRDIPKGYESGPVEAKWYPIWEDKGYFTGEVDSDAPPFSIVLPPPNVTGSLHMGHALNITLHDILARWKRMKGFNVLWVPGTDHAGIATQNVVERQLAEEGIHRNDLGRDEFERRVWEWKEISETRILSQMRRLGCSCDWTRTRFTLDEGLSHAVRKVFVELYEEGLIYRGEYLVNWCPRCATAISDLEVEHEPATGHLWHVKYPIIGNDEYVVVATTRPETMLGDTAVAVHPDDERYKHLHGGTVRLPLMGREIPVIADDFVDPDFGTGVVKVTPGHDPNDFEAGRRNNLPIVRVIGESGKMTGQAGVYADLDRYEARKQVIADLEKLKLIHNIEDHQHNVGRCQRCATVVEPLVSTQWFVRVKSLAEKAVEAVETGATEFIPASFKKIYYEWMNNIHDWCVSRQLWWGHRIPAWYCDACDHIIVELEDPDRCPRCQGTDLRQESDVLDTWFSSGLWPFSTMGWPEETKELGVYYPTTVLITAADIIFFWVARMMMMGIRFMGETPFRQVHFTGLVRTEDGQKMSKSKGNVIDPLEIVEDYGADAVRFTLSSLAAPGTDMPYSVSRMAGYRAFCNKIWNAGRFLLLNLKTETPVDAGDLLSETSWADLPLEDRWILSRLQHVIQATDESLDRFRFHEASHQLYHFFWDELCSWYVEMVKGRLMDDSSPASAEKASRVVLYVLDQSLRLLHPFVPFVTEELWQRLPHQGESLMVAEFPEPKPDWIDSAAVSEMEKLQELIGAIRTARTENRVDPRKRLDGDLIVSDAARVFLEAHRGHVQTLARLSSLTFVSEFEKAGLQARGVASLAQFSLRLGDAADIAAERERIEKLIQKSQEELARLSGQLANEAFVSRAPEAVVAKTRERHGTVRDQLAKLEGQLSGLPDA